MKLSVDKLKSMDWKQFGVNHGEKIALGIVGLLVVLILWKGTRWATFQEKKPEELLAKVDAESKALAAASWPEEAQETYTDKYNVNTVYDNTYSVVKADPFKYHTGHPMIWSLHRRQEPIEEPVWLPVKDLIATPGRFIMELPPPGQEPVTDAAEALASAEETTPLTPSEDALRRQFEKKQSTGGMGDENYTTPDSSMYSGGEMYSGDEMYSGGGGTGVAVNARGVRFVAVRGVFPFREQAEQIFKARHDPSFHQLRNRVSIVNFEIQRQKAKPGPNPWSNNDEDWTALDQSVALDLLRETIDYAEDIVDYNNTYYVITSPLPKRLVGDWTNYFVGHPKIKTMTEKELEYRRLLNEQLVKMKRESSTTDINGVGGFAIAQRDMYSLQNEVMGSQKQNFMSGLMQMMNTDQESGYQLPQEMGNMLASEETPEYLLFRYLDFDVKPGEAYRYRVRLKLRNPNFNELPDNLVAENVGIGEFRYTPWSAPTPIPTADKILPEDSKYFVSDIVAGRGKKEPRAVVDLFQWVSEIGTTANKQIEVLIGQLIGQPEVEMDNSGKAKDEGLLVEVLRPYQSFEKEPLEMATNDAVVDFSSPMANRYRDFHSDLNVRELKPLSQVLIVNEFGELENRNPISQAKQHDLAKTLLKYEYEPWEALKNAKQNLGEGMEGYDGTMEDMYGTSGLYEAGGRNSGGAGPGGASSSNSGGAGRGGAAGPGGRRSGRVNPLRLNRGAGSSSSGP